MRRVVLLAGVLTGILCLAGCTKNGPTPLPSEQVSLQVNRTEEQTQADTTEAGSEAVTQMSSEAVTQESTEEAKQPQTETVPETSSQAVETTEAFEQLTTAAVSTTPWDLLNNEPLNPTKSGYSELDGLIEGYFKMLKDEGTLNDEMSPYQRVRAIYVWFIKRIVYNRGMNVDAGKYSKSDPATTPEEVLWATDLFNTYQGCCYNYSSAFMYIMRALGYDAHLLSGQVASYNGGTTPHCWVYVNLDGVAYTFDPDVDMNYYYRNIDSGEEVTDTLFCKKMDEMGYFYTIEKYHTN